MGKPARRQSIPIHSVIAVSKTLGLLLRGPRRKSFAGLPVVIAPGPLVESEHPKAVAGEHALFSQLCRKSGGPHLGWGLPQSIDLLPRNRCEWNLHGRGIHAAHDRNVLDNGQSRAAPTAGSAESGGRSILLTPVYERRCGYAALSWNAAFTSAPRSQRNDWRKLYMVSLHRNQSRCKQHRQ